MTPTVHRGLDPARSDQDLAREAARRQRAKAEGRTTFGDPGSVNLNAVDSSLIVPPTPNSGPASSSLGVPNDTKTGRVSSRHSGNGRRLGRPPAVPLPLEKDEEQAGDELMALYGFRVIRFSQARASHQTEGIPDRKYFHRARGLAVWWEAKSATGEQRKAQREFQLDCEACGEVYVLGQMEPLRRWLETALEGR